MLLGGESPPECYQSTVNERKACFGGAGYDRQGMPDTGRGRQVSLISRWRPMGVGDPGPLAGSTIPGILWAQIANPGIPNLSPNTGVSTLTKNVDLLPYFWKNSI
jgi:hypothetical protein